MSTDITTTDDVGENLPAIVSMPAAHAGITPAQAKVDAVANLTMKVYERASQLNLTDDEMTRLQADFPDEAFRTGAGGKESLIYIEHAYLRDRLNTVFGPGQWAIVPRSRWKEDFVTKGANGKPPISGVKVYVEAMLCIRGCFVAEAIGDMDYYPSNMQTNYGDAVEGAKSAALRRCSKELGVGLQAWKKAWCDGWWDRKRKGPAQSQQQQNGNGNAQTAKQEQPQTPPPEPPDAIILDAFKAKLLPPAVVGLKELNTIILEELRSITHAPTRRWAWTETKNFATMYRCRWSDEAKQFYELPPEPPKQSEGEPEDGGIPF